MVDLTRYKRVNRCRCCNRNGLIKYLDLGRQPLANNYHTGQLQILYPLEVNFCQNCSHSQLSVVVNPEEMFKNYLYVSGTTETFRNHCAGLAEEAMRGMNNPRVLDIACNDGTLLEAFRELGAEVFGIDPAENLRYITEEKDIPVFIGYWPDNSEDVLGKFDIITGTNVFAHVNDIRGFLNACVEKLHDNGVVILEFPYCDEMISNVEFDTIYHEHLSYFTVKSFKTLANSCGFTITKIVRTPIHGGSIRFYLRHDISDELETPDVKRLMKKESKDGLYNKSTYLDFAKKVEENRCAMVNLLKSLKDKDVVGYGASAKGNTMLNHFKLNLEAIVDDNPMKWGYQTPGRSIIIRSPHLLSKYDELYIVVLSWNFYDEISKKVKSIRGDKKTKFILYVPKVTVND